MEDGQVILYGPDGEPLWRFHTFKAYRASGRMGFLPPEEREYDRAVATVSSVEGPFRDEEPVVPAEAEGPPVEAIGSTEDGACFRPT